MSSFEIIQNPALGKSHSTTEAASAGSNSKRNILSPDFAKGELVFTIIVACDNILGLAGRPENEWNGRS